VSVEHADRPGAPRLVVDAGVYVSAAISGQGAPVQLLEAAVEGRAVLIISPLLVGELRDVLARGKFRRWISQQDADAFVDALVLLADLVDDPSESSWRRLCRDPDDDYLVALMQAYRATLLVTGDRALLELHEPDLDIRSPRNAVDAILYEHPWGPALIPAEPDAAWASAEAAGNGPVLRAAAAVVNVLADPQAEQLLPYIVTPESLAAWLTDLRSARQDLVGRGMATGVEYFTPDIAYVRLPPDPGETVKATGDILTDTRIITLLRRPDLPTVQDFEGWRVHAAGDYWRPPEGPNLDSPGHVS
jgi:putative PIN family toxin of toxin-antitoxin system